MRAGAAPRTRVGVIMAGGSGERFWPLSRRDHPKQLLRLTDPDRTMIQEAVDRLSPLIPPDHIYLVTAAHLAAAMRSADTGLPDENILAEPCKRNTSGALAYAASWLLEKYGGRPECITMAVTTADHEIGRPERFRACIEVAMDTAETLDVLVTLGIEPTRPETGYGYIHVREEISRTQADGGPISAYEVDCFQEKPSRELAEDYIARGGYYWNSGMFFWTVDAFLRELGEARPELRTAILDMASAHERQDAAGAAGIFESLEDISIDFALMERAARVCMVRADFPWDDVGAWTALERTRPHDKDGNVIVGGAVVVDSEDCIVVNDAGEDRIAVGVVGAEKLVVVVTKDAVLVIPKHCAQDVRKVVRELQARNAKQV